MSPLWGPKANSGDEAGGGGGGGNQDVSRDRGSRVPEEREREPDERTRLLPRGEAYLSPDDPAVSIPLYFSN